MITATSLLTDPSLWQRPLETASAAERSEQVQATAREFESLFMSILLKEMRSTAGEGFFAGDSSDVYGSLFDLHMGRALADGNMFDLAK